MNILDLVKNIDKSEYNSNWVDSNHYAESLGIAHCNSLDVCPGLKSYWIWKRYDTDSYVGLEFIFLNDEFIATNTTTGRKNGDGEINYLNQEVADKLRDLLLQLLNHAYPEDIAPLIDLNATFDDIGYKVDYTSELLTSTVYHIESQQYVSVAQKFVNEQIPGRYMPSVIKIKFNSGETEYVDISSCLVPYNTIK
tara:strand:- start:2887 stop:3471 length:585 start_codon:yes stop_codon:yes gene_type:complete